ncbi:hypothetical protein WJX81_002345 [Elliptochloris bilobata]|uniref:Uncharacterized protein n=1 Tax=Elliptochloris bilobata TaxID=381761 RepID=A0AAW1RI31_9CHLO
MQAEVLEKIVSTIVAAQAPTASNDQRNAAAHALTQLKKSSEPHTVVSIAGGLVTDGRPLEVQHFGFQLLQHLVGVRWDDFSNQEHLQLASLAFDLLQRVGRAGAGWAVRSKAALLLALVAKRQGPALWAEVLPRLVAAAQEGPLQAEMVCMVLRFEAEEVTQSSEAMEDAPKRALLGGLVGSLDVVLPFLAAALEASYGRAQEALAKGDTASAAANAAVVSAALATVTVYMEWAPLPQLANSGLLRACAYLLEVPDFRLAACEALRVLSLRRQAQEDRSVYNAMMDGVGEALMRAAGAALAPGAAAGLAPDGPLDELGQRLADTMAAFGASHLAVLTSPEKRIAFLQQMLAFTRSPNTLLASKALPLWPALLEASERGKGKAPAGAPPPPTVQLPAECVEALLDLAAEQLRNSVHLVEGEVDMPSAFDDFAEFRAFAAEYRTLLGRIARLAAAQLPAPALAAASRRLSSALELCSTSGPRVEERQSAFEAAVVFMESVLQQVCTVHLRSGRPGEQLSPTAAAVVAAGEALLQQVLGAHLPGDAGLLGSHARALEAFARLVPARPDLLPAIIQKAFDLFGTLPLEGDPHEAPPARPPPGWKERFQARQKVAGCLIPHASAAPKVMAPHLTAFAARVDELWGARRMWPGERCVLSDAAMLAASKAGDPNLQGQVVEWVLAPVRARWQSPAWQATLGSPAAFLAAHMPLAGISAGFAEVGGRLARWELYHDLHRVEHAAKRGPCSRTLGAASADPRQPGWHVLNGHLPWMLPPLLQLMRCLNAVWEPQGRAALAGAAVALDMGPREHAMYLRKRLGPEPLGGPEEEASTLAGPTPGALRTWLRQVRESLYQGVGILATQAAGFFAAGPETLSLWAPALDEVVAERLLRELTQELMALLKTLHYPSSGGSQGSLMVWLAAHAPSVAMAAAMTATAALWWPDEALSNAAAFCRRTVPMATTNPRLRELVGRDMLRGAIAALGMRDAGAAQSELLSLVREILVQELASSPGPAQELAALPRMTPARLNSFRAEVAKRPGDKAAGKLVRKLLQSTASDDLAEALADVRPPISNLASLRQPRIRYPPADPDGNM